jgi:Tol biopolymer transport system component
MRRRNVLFVALAMGYGVACASVLGIDDLPGLPPNREAAAYDVGTIMQQEGSVPDDDHRVDAACALDMDFGPSTPVPGLDQAGNDGWPWLTPDEKTIVFASKRLADPDYHLYSASRTDRKTPFSNVIRVDGLGTSYRDLEPVLTPDQLRLIFVRSSNGTRASYDLHQALRVDASGPFQPAAPLNVTAAGAYDAFPFLTADGKELWFASERGDAGAEIYRSSVGATFGPPQLVPELNSPEEDSAPILSADGKVVFFSSSRPAAGVQGATDIWTAKRDDPGGTFGPATLVPGLNTTFEDWPAWLSPDGCRLYLTSDRVIYVAERPAL